VVDGIVGARAGRTSGRWARVFALERPPDGRTALDLSGRSPGARFATPLGTGVDGARVRGPRLSGIRLGDQGERGGKDEGETDHIFRSEPGPRFLSPFAGFGRGRAC
jgi:hypothetical protein